MDQTTPGDLPAQWRERAHFLRDYGGDPPAAKVWEVAAAELEVALRTFQAEALTLTKAAQASGYSVDHLGDLVRKGRLPNAGRKNAPLVRRADLPIKHPRPHGDRTPSSVPVADPNLRHIADKLRGHP